MATRLPLITLAAATLIGAPLAFAGSVEEMAADCNSCHGDNGVSQFTDVPTIAGLSLIYHEDNLFAYMDEARPCVESEYRHGDTSKPATTMCAIAADLSEDDMTALAEHYEAMEFVPATQEFDESLVATGATVHEDNCEKCHTDGGSNADDDAGFLAGQHSGYLRQTIAAYRAGEREQPKTMKEKLDPLSDDEIEALINYYASQQ